MGNVTIKTTHRRKITKLLMYLPTCFFGATPRILINKNLIEWKRNVFTLIESDDKDWDSALDLSCDSESSTSYQPYSPRTLRRRRFSYCCGRSNDKEELLALQEELKSLRLQVSELMAKSGAEKSENMPEARIPNPPPLPCLLEDGDGDNVYCSTPKSNRKEVLFKDITNVKLKPIDRSSTKRTVPKASDVRHDLHEILKKRYAAMHSPRPRRFCFNESDDENRLTYKSDCIFAC